MPLLLTLLAVLALITFVPQLSLFLTNLLMGDTSIPQRDLDNAMDRAVRSQPGISRHRTSS